MLEGRNPTSSGRDVLDVLHKTVAKPEPEAEGTQQDGQQWARTEGFLLGGSGSVSSLPQHWTGY